MMLVVHALTLLLTGGEGHNGAGNDIDAGA